MTKSNLSRFIVASLAVFSVACTQETRQKISTMLDFGTGIISNRDQSSTQVTALIKLQTPALLATASRDDAGNISTDPDQLKQIQAEQAQLISDLTKLSSDVKVLFQYKMVLNGVAIQAPKSIADKLGSFGNVAFVESDGTFNRPVLDDATKPVSPKEDFSLANSVKWIGAENLHAKGITGKGVKVGVIDTGIDYTHSMLGGPGQAAAYKAIDPNKPSTLFPNKKVVGGVDLAGTNFDAASADDSKRIPHPDANPLDEMGHGSHVSGTIAGNGDGVNTYDGVAPDAQLYGIKVFGAKGSTSDSVVIAGLEYASDPSGAGTGAGHLDVVNLSLGSPFGQPHVLYGEAAHNLVNGGTVMVAAAGNEGALAYIVGSPAVVKDSIAVAANTDNSAHNWQFAAIKFVGSTQTFLAPVIEGPISTPVASAGNITGKLVEAGMGDTPFSDALKAQIKGNVAFMHRGVVPFTQKLSMALDAGAIGVIVGNNQPGDPIQMGGDGNFALPAVMVTQAIADNITEEMSKGDVVVSFQTSDKIQRPELIDTIADFSSQGPRGEDGYLKPEITAPGVNVVSVAMGTGSDGVQMSGTSMATPHMTGVMALLKQAFPKLTPVELKSLVMGRTKTIADAKAQVYSVTRQGAGRVQVDVAAASPVVAEKVSLSFGEQNIESKKEVRDTLTFKNISGADQTFQVAFEGSPSVTMVGPSSLSLKAGESQSLSLGFVLDATQSTDSLIFFEGWVKLKQNGAEVFRVPMLAVSHKISQITPSSLLVRSTSEADAAGAAVDLTLTNAGLNSGRAFLFNLLGTNLRLPDPNHDKYKNTECELQSAGYRLVDKTVNGSKLRMLQIGVKLFQPMTNWQTCELTVLIGGNTNGLADQELDFTMKGDLAQYAGASDQYSMVSLLLDAAKARDIRKQFETASRGPVDPKNPPVEDYTPAMIDMEPADVYNNSTLAIAEADVTKLAVTPTGDLQVKVLTTNDDESALLTDDYLNGDPNAWLKVSLQSQSQSYNNLPLEVDVPAGQAVPVALTKGEGSNDLMVVFPDNRTVSSDVVSDEQGFNLKPLFGSF